MSSILSPYNPTSWFHPIGIKKVLKRFKDRLPNVENCLFITLTIDPHLFENESSAFDHARDRIRRMFHRLRKGMKWDGKQFTLKSAYAVKVEFHENGWPHFHIIFLTKRFIPRGLLDHLWGYGWTKIDRIKQESFEYLLKYVTKSATLPDWVLERKRIRIFQTSRGFLLPDPSNKKPHRSEKEDKKQERDHSSTIGERIERWKAMAKLTSATGEVRTIELPCSFKSTLDHLIFEVALDGRYLGESKVLINNRKELIVWIKTSKHLMMGQDSSSVA